MSCDQPVYICLLYFFEIYCKNLQKLFRIIYLQKIAKIIQKISKGKFWKEKNDIHFQTPIINNINYF